MGSDNFTRTVPLVESKTTMRVVKEIPEDIMSSLESEPRKNALALACIANGNPIRKNNVIYRPSDAQKILAKI